MAKFMVQLNFLLLLLLTALNPILVNSTEHADFGSMPTEEQQIFAGTIVRPGESFICHAKRDLIQHLEQLSFYLKADCQNANTSFIGCSCWPPRCAASCTPARACCAQNTTALLHELDGFNAFYASHFRELFGAAPPKAFQLDE